MVQLRYDSKKKQWIELKERENLKDRPDCIRLDGFLKEKLDNIIKIRKKGWDTIFIIDGPRRSGKSTVAKTCGFYLYPNISVKNYVSGMGDALDKIESLPDESVVIFDEASLTFSSKDHANRDQKQLLKVIDVIGVKRMTMILVLPTFFELTKPLAIHNSRFLLHVYTGKDLKRGRMAYFGVTKKRTLFDIGRKNYNSYYNPEADWVGTFSDYIPTYEKEYEVLKKKSRDESFNKKSLSSFNKDEYRDFVKITVANNIKLDEPLTSKQLASLFGLSMRSIQAYTKEIRDKDENARRKI